jgi:hypothetical protein
MSKPGGEDPSTGPQPRMTKLVELATRARSAQLAVEPALIIIIGLALGIVDQASVEVSSVLRVPALVGALVLVGQGLTLLDHARRGGAATVTAPDPVPVTAPPGPSDQTSGGPVNKGQDVAGPLAATNTPGALPWLVAGLAVWLGVATLAHPDAPLSLSLLSLLAAYLLFARGWRSLVPPRR